MNDTLPTCRPHLSARDRQQVMEVLKSQWLTCGPQIEKLETAFEKLTQAPAAVAVANATLALAAIGEHLGIGKGDAVLLSSINFVADAGQFMRLGATPVFMDVDPESGLSTIEHYQEALLRAKSLGLKPALVIVLHLGGRLADLKDIAQQAHKDGLEVIEDACHAVGNSNVGSCKYSRFAIFSLHAVKTITAGEGGIICCQSKKDAKNLRMFRHHWLERKNNNWDYKVRFLGSNLRISDISAALALSQLERLDKIVAERKTLVERYSKLLKNLPLKACKPGRESKPLEGKSSTCYHLFQVLIRPHKSSIKRDALIKHLRKEQIMASLHYPALHRQPLFGTCERLRGAESFCDNVVSLPFYNSLRARDQKRVALSLTNFFAKNQW